MNTAEKKPETKKKYNTEKKFETVTCPECFRTYARIQGVPRGHRCKK